MTSRIVSALLQEKHQEDDITTTFANEDDGNDDLKFQSPEELRDICKLPEVMSLVLQTVVDMKTSFGYHLGFLLKS